VNKNKIKSKIIVKKKKLEQKLLSERKIRAMFLGPCGGGLVAMYTVHLRLIGKLVAGFLFVLIDLFSLGVTAEALTN